MKALTYEHFSVGTVFPLGTVAVNFEEMVEFSRRYDPQPFHLDAVAGEQSLFGAMCASGWHTCLLWMRAWVDGVVSRVPATGSPGISDLRWLAPVFPGDVLTAGAEVLTARVSKSRPHLGLVSVRGTMHRGDAAVMQMDSVLMIELDQRF